MSLEPKESKRLGGICPKCKRPLTIGVEYRVEELASRPAGFKPEGAKPFKSLVPLSEIIALATGTTNVMSKRVWTLHSAFMKLGSEFYVLIDCPKEDLDRVDEKVANHIVKVRSGEVEIIPGYDGVYGKLILSEEDRARAKEEAEKEKSKAQKAAGKAGEGAGKSGQKSLGDF